ncbi:MAG: hypothetical protein LC734_01515 [Acidobacteria bacterium]|nr:hypothetical protein [Acidobacteriota bacterium]
MAARAAYGEITARDFGLVKLERNGAIVASNNHKSVGSCWISVLGYQLSEAFDPGLSEEQLADD